MMEFTIDDGPQARPRRRFRHTPVQQRSAGVGDLFV